MSEPAKKRSRDEVDATGDTAKVLEAIFSNDRERITFTEKQFREGPDIDATYERVLRDNQETLFVRCSHKNCRAKRFAEQELVKF